MMSSLRRRPLLIAVVLFLCVHVATAAQGQETLLHTGVAPMAVGQHHMAVHIPSNTLWVSATNGTLLVYELDRQSTSSSSRPLRLLWSYPIQSYHVQFAGLTAFVSCGLEGIYVFDVSPLSTSSSSNSAPVTPLPLSRRLMFGNSTMCASFSGDEGSVEIVRIHVVASSSSECDNVGFPGGTAKHLLGTGNKKDISTAVAYFLSVGPMDFSVFFPSQKYGHDTEGINFFSDNVKLKSEFVFGIGPKENLLVTAAHIYDPAQTYSTRTCPNVTTSMGSSLSGEAYVTLIEENFIFAGCNDGRIYLLVVDAGGSVFHLWSIDASPDLLTDSSAASSRHDRAARTLALSPDQNILFYTNGLGDLYAVTADSGADSQVLGKLRVFTPPPASVDPNTNSGEQASSSPASTMLTNVCDQSIITGTTLLVRCVDGVHRIDASSLWNTTATNFYRFKSTQTVRYGLQGIELGLSKSDVAAVGNSQDPMAVPIFLSDDGRLYATVFNPFTGRATATGSVALPAAPTTIVAVSPLENPANTHIFMITAAGQMLRMLYSPTQETFHTLLTIYPLEGSGSSAETIQFFAASRTGKALALVLSNDTLVFLNSSSTTAEATLYGDGKQKDLPFQPLSVRQAEFYTDRYCFLLTNDSLIIMGAASHTSTDNTTRSCSTSFVLLHQYRPQNGGIPTCFGGVATTTTPVADDKRPLKVFLSAESGTEVLFVFFDATNSSNLTLTFSHQWTTPYWRKLQPSELVLDPEGKLSFVIAPKEVLGETEDVEPTILDAEKNILIPQLVSHPRFPISTLNGAIIAAWSNYSEHRQPQEGAAVVASIVFTTVNAETSGSLIIYGLTFSSEYTEDRAQPIGALNDKCFGNLPRQVPGLASTLITTEADAGASLSLTSSANDLYLFERSCGLCDSQLLSCIHDDHTLTLASQHQLLFSAAFETPVLRGCLRERFLCFQKLCNTTAFHGERVAELKSVTAGLKLENETLVFKSAVRAACYLLNTVGSSVPLPLSGFYPFEVRLIFKVTVTTTDMRPVLPTIQALGDDFAAFFGLSVEPVNATCPSFQACLYNFEVLGVGKTHPAAAALLNFTLNPDAPEYNATVWPSLRHLDDAAFSGATFQSANEADENDNGNDDGLAGEIVKQTWALVLIPLAGGVILAGIIGGTVFLIFLFRGRGKTKVPTKTSRTDFPFYGERADVDLADLVGALASGIEGGMPEQLLLHKARILRLTVLSFTPERPEAPLSRFLTLMDSPQVSLLHRVTKKEIGLIAAVFAIHVYMKYIVRQLPLDSDTKSDWLHHVARIRNSECVETMGPDGFHTNGLDFALDVITESINSIESYFGSPWKHEVSTMVGAIGAGFAGDLYPLADLLTDSAGVLHHSSTSWLPDVIYVLSVQCDAPDQAPVVKLLLAKGDGNASQLSRQELAVAMGAHPRAPPTNARVQEAVDLPVISLLERRKELATRIDELHRRGTHADQQQRRLHPLGGESNEFHGSLFRGISTFDATEEAAEDIRVRILRQRRRQRQQNPNSPPTHQHRRRSELGHDEEESDDGEDTAFNPDDEDWHAIYQWLLFVDNVFSLAPDPQLHTASISSIIRLGYYAHSDWRVREKVADTIALIFEDYYTQGTSFSDNTSSSQHFGSSDQQSGSSQQPQQRILPASVLFAEQMCTEMLEHESDARVLFTLKRCEVAKKEGTKVYFEQQRALGKAKGRKDGSSNEDVDGSPGLRIQHQPRGAGRGGGRMNQPRQRQEMSTEFFDEVELESIVP